MTFGVEVLRERTPSQPQFGIYWDKIVPGGLTRIQAAEVAGLLLLCPEFEAAQLVPDPIAADACYAASKGTRDEP